MPRIETKRFSKSFNGLHFDLRFSATLKLLVEFELKASYFRHLFLREIRAQAKLPEIFGQMMNGNHCPC